MHISSTQPPLIFCDNVSIGHLAKHHVLHSKTKHVDIDFNFVREKAIVGDLCVEFTPNQEQIANILTMPLCSSKFVELKTKLGILCRLWERGEVIKCVYKSLLYSYMTNRFHELLLRSYMKI